MHGLALLALALAACGERHVDYVPLASGHFKADVLNTPPELQGIEMTLDLAHDRLELHDGDRTFAWALKRVPDRNAWVGGCGTETSYAMLEIAELSPHTTIELRGQTMALERVHADCYTGGLWLIAAPPIGRLIFSR